MKNKWLKIAGAGLLAMLIVAYFGVMIFNADLNTKALAQTEYAVRYTYDETITADSIIVRDEETISYTGAQVLYYIVNDGDTVKANAPVAYVFSEDEDALSYKHSSELKAEIKILEDLNASGKNSSTDYSAIDKQIEHNVKKVISSANANNFAEVNNYSDELIYNINQRQIITGQVENFDTQIAELQSELTQCEAESKSYQDVIYTKIPGYFVSYTDGYENVYDYNTIKDMTVSEFDKDVKPQAVSQNIVGKTVSGPNWYVVCKLSSDEAITLSHANMSTLLSFPNASCNDIPATLESLNQSSKQSDAIAVFRCNYMSPSISHLRNETVDITVNSFSGLRISKSAIHDDYVEIADSETGETKKVQGVYVLRGSELVFKEIVIIYADNDFVIIKEHPDEGELVSGETVTLNDSIVINSEDLYAGKNVK